MTPLFSPDCDLVGWKQDGNHIFDTDMNWVAYISNGHVWSAQSGNWLGPIHGGCVLDHAGKVVAWSSGQPVSGTMAPMRPMKAMRAMSPMRPMRPMMPMRPMRPMVPMGGWSSNSWASWIAQ